MCVSVGKSASDAASVDTFVQACRFFDRECAGYLDADDLEEIAFMVSDSISRTCPYPTTTALYACLHNFHVVYFSIAYLLAVLLSVVHVIATLPDHTADAFLCAMLRLLGLHF